MDLLASTLAKENQRLPIDLPEAHRASLGGVIATNTSGARRYGHGTVRDYVIGITAVDGRGDVFHGGGRVVKNVAGYDFCKLLTGSLGTLGVITQVTLRVKPIPECSRLVACAVHGWDSAERALQSLVTTQSTPVAIEFVAGDAWNADPAIGPRDDSVGCAVLGLEGTEPEVTWMAQAVCEELQSIGERPVVLSEHESSRLWMRLAQFPVEGNAALVVKASLKPSQMLQFIRTLRYIDPGCSIQAHAGNGIVVARFPQLDAGRLSRMLVGQLQPAAAEHEGHMIVLSCRWPQELTRQAAWGSIGASAAVMEEIKRQFDPKNLLNRGRFVFTG
jgi:glycolate oxidase FAD binding subunit